MYGNEPPIEVCCECEAKYYDPCTKCSKIFEIKTQLRKGMCKRCTDKQNAAPKNVTGPKCVDCKEYPAVKDKDNRCHACYRILQDTLKLQQQKYGETRRRRSGFHFQGEYTPGPRSLKSRR